MSENKELKLGDAIELTDDQFAVFDQFAKRQFRNMLVIDSIGCQMEIEREEFWRTAKEMFPETVDFVCQFDRDARKIRIARKKGE